MSTTEEKKDGGDEPQAQSTPKKPNIVKRLWQKSGLSLPIVLLMMKGGLPPTIALAAFEGHAFAGIYTTLGYLVAIMSHLSMCIQPRAKFIQSMTFNVLFLCIGAALALLQIQCVVAARSPPVVTATHTGGSGSTESLQYDSSANAVSAVFLFLYVYLCNFFKAKRPQLMIPCIMASIFTVVASIYAPSFPNMTAGMAFVRRLMLAFLTGYGIATGVSLLILPTTSRSMVEKKVVGLTGLMKASLGAHGAYMHSITVATKEGVAPTVPGRAEAAKLKDLVQKGGALFGDIRLELGFARKEVAWGKLKPEDFSTLYEKLRQIMIPIIGLSTFMEILQSVQERSTSLMQNERHVEAIKRLQTEEWDEVMTMSHTAYLELRTAMMGGLEHMNYQLEFAKKPKTPKKDAEEKVGASPRPGETGFSSYLEAEVTKFHQQRDMVLHMWAEKKGIQLPKHFWETGPAKPGDLSREETNATTLRNRMNQQQLYLILFIEFLTYHVGKAILELAKYADSKVEDGTMKRKKLILPGWRRVKKLLEDACSQADLDETMNSEVNGGSNIFVGDAFKQRKDPEHLPPTNFYEKFTDHFRFLSKALQSEESHFAFRAALAALSIGIIGFLKATRPFFLEQRGLWAIIMTAISMDLRAGQSVFSYVCRVGGTVLAMLGGMAIWYMCDSKHPAIIVLFYIWVCLWTGFLIKNPQFAMVAMISMVTVILILGYEMQVEVLGVKVATSNGQEFYQTYLLAPYRLVAVAAGIGVAFIWTYFPYPITTRTSLRQDLGTTLYVLANWYSCVHTTLEVRLNLGPRVHQLDKSSPVHQLDKARLKVFGKIILLLTKLRTHLRFLKFEPPVGGKFPKETYTKLMDSTRNIFAYLALMSHSALAFTGEDDDTELDDDTMSWLRDFREFAASSKVTSHELTSTLCLLSASVTNSTPIPPYIQVPRPYDLGERMQEIDPELLSLQHLTHPCYAAFAVMEVTSALVTSEMTKLVENVKQLVGEVDFSFHVVSTADDGSSSSSTLWDGLKEVDSSGSGSGNGKAKDD